MVVESPQDARDVHGVDEYKGEGGKQPIRTVHAKTAQHTYRNAVGLTAVRETKVVVHFKVVHGKRGFERCAPNHALLSRRCRETRARAPGQLQQLFCATPVPSPVRTEPAISILVPKRTTESSTACLQLYSDPMHSPALTPKPLMDGGTCGTSGRHRGRGA